MGRRRGFFLLETMVIVLLLASLAACFSVYRSALYAKEAAAARWSAQYIAQQQFAELSYRGRKKRLEEGSLPWLGRQEDLLQNGVSFCVATEIHAEEQPMATVRVLWEIGGKAQELSIKRRIVYEERRL